MTTHRYTRTLVIRQTLRVLRGTRRRLEQRAREQAIARRSPVPGSTRLTYAGPLEASEIVRRAARYPYWYHSFYLSNGAAIRGLYDVGADVAAYGFPTDMSGLNVLDVGMASGWFAFYLERLGASVTAVDVRTDDELDWYGRWQEPSPQPKQR